MKFILLAVILALATAVPQNYRSKRPLRPNRRVTFGNSVIRKSTPGSDTALKRFIQNVPKGAKLIDVSGPISDEDLHASLVDNATTIRENIVGGFDCAGRIYGYYADTLNDCQIFHVCVPMDQIFPDANFEYTEVYHYSFICPKNTIFSQDYLTCAYEEDAFPCHSAEQMYWEVNDKFFKVVDEEEVEDVDAEVSPTNGYVTVIEDEEDDIAEYEYANTHDDAVWGGFVDSDGFTDEILINDGEKFKILNDDNVYEVVGGNWIVAGSDVAASENVEEEEEDGSIQRIGKQEIEIFGHKISLDQLMRFIKNSSGKN